MQISCLHLGLLCNSRTLKYCTVDTTTVQYNTGWDAVQCNVGYHSLANNNAGKCSIVKYTQRYSAVMYHTVRQIGLNPVQESAEQCTVPACPLVELKKNREVQCNVQCAVQQSSAVQSSAVQAIVCSSVQKRSAVQFSSEQCTSVQFSSVQLES